MFNIRNLEILKFLKKGIIFLLSTETEMEKLKNIATTANKK